MKTCTTCNVEKSFEEFSKSPISNDGYQYKCKKCFAEWYRTNRLHILSKEKDRHIANQDAINSKKRLAYKANPLSSHLKSQKRRAQKEKNGVYKVTTKEFKKLQTQPCFYCGSTERIEIDHIIPISRGGAHSIGNLVSACFSCNRSKRNKTITEWKGSK